MERKQLKNYNSCAIVFKLVHGNGEFLMKNYRFLLFDLDDTLLDFGAAERIALPKLFEAHGFSLTPEIEDIYHKINSGYGKH